MYYLVLELPFQVRLVHKDTFNSQDEAAAYRDQFRFAARFVVVSKQGLHRDAGRWTTLTVPVKNSWQA